MHYHIVSLFPEWFKSPLNTALFAKAEQEGIVQVSHINPRDFTDDKHNKVDDRPYGGGPGMVLMPQPILDAVKSIKNCGQIIALTPSGEPFTQELAAELSKEDDLTLICGRYEGFDERIYSLLPIRKISVGDAIFNGGEVAALAIIEATARLQDGYMGKNESGNDESFSQGLLEYPHFTRPEIFYDLPVPKVLSSGNHAQIDEWRKQNSLEMTYRYRSDLLEEAELSDSDRKYVNSLPSTRNGRNIHLALLHYPVLLKSKVAGTSSITNLDIHDIARIACTYGLASFNVITPLEDQLDLLKTLVNHWTIGQGADSNPDRAKALRLVRASKSLEETIQSIINNTGQKPYVLGTSAKAELDKKGREYRKAISFKTVKSIVKEQSTLILLGTSHGLAPEILHSCDALLAPIRWGGNYNHLPVRAACAIILDRLLGDFG